MGVLRGIRPSIPKEIPPETMEVWNIAQECWSQQPRDRPSLKAVLDKLEDLARMGDPRANSPPQPSFDPLVDANDNDQNMDIGERLSRVIKAVRDAAGF